MVMKNLKYFIVFSSIAGLLLGCGPTPEKTKVLPAHSHNDYEHECPLLDALDCHFKSIEADVYSIGDSLFVSHDAEDIKPGRTLRGLYLEPLKKLTEENNGSVYGNGEEIILLVDIKDDGLRTYKLLHKILENYRSVITEFNDGNKIRRAVMVVVSGNRPLEYMEKQAVRYAGYDGRLDDLDKGLPPSLMPLVSNSWGQYFKWDGIDEMPDAEKMKLRKFANQTKELGYLLRFWGTPNQTEQQRKAVWKELNEVNVSLIGADNLKELELFLSQNN